MFEVERKFHLTADEKERLLNGAQFIGEKQFVDVYYDTADYRLTTQNWWLRSRAGQWELKLSRAQHADRSVTNYQELTTESDIRSALHLSPNGTLENTIRQHGYVPFCLCTTTRRKYQKGEFGIDLDEVTYADALFTYTIAEIERVVPQQSEMEQAVQDILSFAHGHRLTMTPVRGKVLEYLKRIWPDHYQALVGAGTVKDF